jgi:hypothetical protein
MTYLMPLIGNLLPFAFPVFVFSAQVGCDPQETPVPENVLQQEERLLAQRKEERVQDLERRLQNAAGEQRMGVLLQLADLGTARAIEIIDRNIDSVDDRGTLLNAAVCQGHVEARPLLLRAVNSWTISGHPIERLHCVFGPEFAPELRKRLPGAANDVVRRAIRTELIRLKDPQAIAELRAALAGAQLRTREEAEEAFALLSMAMELVDLAADVGQLFRRVDERGSEAHRHLKQFAAGIALWLGDHDSAEHVIDLLAAPGSDSFNYPGLHSLVEILKTHTKQSFARPEEWKEWWKSKGHATPLFTVHVAPEDEAGIVNAAIRWGRDRTSGPFVPGPIVYLQDYSKYWIGRERFRARLDPDIRPYTGTEISLLGKNPYSVTRVESNGEIAYADLGDGSCQKAWRLVRVELAKQSGEWRVVRQTDR